MRVVITLEHIITMVRAGTTASFRSTASTGAMMAGPLDPRMPAISVAQNSKMIILRMIFGVPRKLLERLMASLPGTAGKTIAGEET